MQAALALESRPAWRASAGRRLLRAIVRQERDEGGGCVGRDDGGGCVGRNDGDKGEDGGGLPVGRCDGRPIGNESRGVAMMTSPIEGTETNEEPAPAPALRGMVSNTLV